MIKYLVLITILLAPNMMYAENANVFVYNGDTAVVKINPAGTLIEFDKSIRVVGDTSQFKIEEIATSVDEKTNKPVNVKILKIIPKAQNSSENVAFVLTGNMSFTLKLSASPEASKQYRLKSNSSASSTINLNARKNSSSLNRSFLEEEIFLMKQMLLDEGVGFNREITNRKFFLTGYENKVDMEMIRQFEGRGLIGFVFKVENITEETLKLNPKTLQFGNPSKAVLMQIDHETLEPCSKNNSNDPSSNSCVAVMRLVLRSQTAHPQGFGGEMPFKLAE